MAQLWEVVGGADKGGIIVRGGVEVASPQEAERLSTGALVRELKLVGERLHYERIEGTGPATGWVSIALKDGRALLTRSSRSEPPPPELYKFEPATSRISFDTPPREPLPPELKATMAPFDPSRMGELFTGLAWANEPGEHFGIQFPHTVEQVEKGGPEWLTVAFHAAGTLPQDNSVTQIVSIKSFAGGGAAEKAVMVVEYEKPDENLHTELFLKLPLDMSEKNRMFCIQLAMEGSELIFNRFMIRCLPLRTPKYYFGDLNMKTTNWILISEKLPFADKSTRGQRLGPYELEAPVLKGMDWILPDKVEKYYALWRTNAIMCAWGHSGKLGDLSELYPMPEVSRNVIFPVPEKRFAPFWEQTKDFILNVAPSCFPKEIANATYMAQLEKEVKEVAANIHCCNDHLKNIGKDFWGLIHVNCQLDNSFFWVDEAGRVDAGLLDFGGLGLALLGQILAGGMASADADVRAEHLEGLCHCFADTLREFGGPSLNAGDLYLNVAFVEMKNITGTMQTVEGGGFGGILEHKPRDQWASITQGLRDPIFEVEDVATMMLRTSIVGLVEGIRTWRLARYYEKFSQWRARFGKEKKK